MTQSTLAMSAMRPITILLVEDNPGDVRLTIELLRAGKISNTVRVAQDGREALAFVRREGHFADAPRPDLILLDLDLPVKDGRQVLAEITTDPELRTIPVVILTASRAEHDVLHSEQLAARAYMAKPVDAPQLIGVIEAIADFGVTISTVSAESLR